MYLCFASTSFSQGNIVHCGLRNGAIVSVDLRERPGRPFPRLTRHQIRYQSSSKTCQTSTKKQWFEVLLRSCNDFVLVTTFHFFSWAFFTSHNILFLQLQGNINPSHVIYMPSSLTWLVHDWNQIWNPLYFFVFVTLLICSFLLQPEDTKNFWSILNGKLHGWNSEYLLALASAYTYYEIVKSIFFFFS